MHAEAHILLVCERRHPRNGFLLQTAGVLSETRKPGENAAENVRRGLREELGIDAAETSSIEIEPCIAFTALQGKRSPQLCECYVAAVTTGDAGALALPHDSRHPRQDRGAID